MIQKLFLISAFLISGYLSLFSVIILALFVTLGIGLIMHARIKTSGTRTLQKSIGYTLIASPLLTNIVLAISMGWSS